MVVVWVIRYRRTNMLFKRAVPQKRLAHEHGSEDMLKDFARRGYHDVIFASAIGKRLRYWSFLVAAGDSQANGAAERAVQSLREQVRVLRPGLETRLGVKLRGMHQVVAWLVEHVAYIFRNEKWVPMAGQAMTG